MYRWLIVFAAMLVGCVASLPQDATITADLACEGAVIEVQSRATPAPTPDGNVCERCNGTGVIGDRVRIRETCPDCGGTGKKTKSVVVQAGAAQPQARPAPVRVPVQNCPDGRCPLR